MLQKASPHATGRDSAERRRLSCCPSLFLGDRRPTALTLGERFAGHAALDIGGLRLLGRSDFEVLELLARSRRLARLPLSHGCSCSDIGRLDGTVVDSLLLVAARHFAPCVRVEVKVRPLRSQLIPSGAVERTLLSCLLAAHKALLRESAHQVLRIAQCVNGNQR